MYYKYNCGKEIILVWNSADCSAQSKDWQVHLNKHHLAFASGIVYLIMLVYAKYSNEYFTARDAVGSHNK